MLLFDVLLKMTLHFTLTEIIIYLVFFTEIIYYLKEPTIFSNFRQYHSTPSRLNYPVTDSSQDISTSLRFLSETSFDSFNPPKSIKSIEQHKSDLYSLPTYLNLPSSTSQRRII